MWTIETVRAYCSLNMWWNICGMFFWPTNKNENWAHPTWSYGMILCKNVHDLKNIVSTKKPISYSIFRICRSCVHTIIKKFIIIQDNMNLNYIFKTVFVPWKHKIIPKQITTVLDTWKVFEMCQAAFSFVLRCALKIKNDLKNNEKFWLFIWFKLK